MKNKVISTLVIASTSIMLLLSGCNFTTIFKNQFNTENKITEPLPWNKIKEIIKKDKLTVDDLNKIPDNFYGLVEIKASEAKELIKIYNKTKYSRVKKTILKIINNNFTNFTDSTSNSIEVDPNVRAIATDKKIVNFYYSIARSNDPIFSPIAVKGLIAREGSDKTWKNWSWSRPVLNLLKEIVNRDMYKLSEFNYYELLNFNKRYPNSLYIKAAKEYGDFTGDTYFNGGGSLRTPLSPNKEIEFVPKFLKKYPGHPASDDAMYRLARAYEIKGDYVKAIFWYDKSSKAPDRELNVFAKLRILLIIDLLMSSNQLTRFLNNYPNHSLTPYIKYSRVINLIRNKQYSTAEVELKIFKNKYRNFLLENLNQRYFNSLIYIDSNFWTKVSHQLEKLEKLNNIYEKGKSDKALYNEAKFWLSEDNLFTAYNYLWNGYLRDTYDSFVPEWEGRKTFIYSSVTSEFTQKAKQSYISQIPYNIAIKVLEQLLREYPNSQLADDAKYSIGLAHYNLWAKQYPIFTGSFYEEGQIRQTRVLNSFEEFVGDFPKSSLADDALYSIAYVKSFSNPQQAKEVIQRLLQDYPNSDIKSEAKKLMRKIK